MIGITEYIVFFDFSTFRPLGGMSNWLISTFRPLVGRAKWLISMNIYWIFSTFRLFRLFRPLGRRSKWSNLLKIFNYFRLLDFSTSCWEVKILILLNILDFFDFLVSCWKNWAIFMYIEFFQLFDFSTSCREVKMIDFTDYRNDSWNLDEKRPKSAGQLFYTVRGLTQVRS